MNIKICLPPRKRPMTLHDLPDMAALVPVGWWQEVSTSTLFDWACGVHLYTPGEPYSYCAIRQRTADGWSEWRIGTDFAAKFAKFEIEAPWTLEGLKEVKGPFAAINFSAGHETFRAEYVLYRVGRFLSVGAALDYALNDPRYSCLIINQETHERVLEVTP